MKVAKSLLLVVMLTTVNNSESSADKVCSLKLIPSNEIHEENVTFPGSIFLRPTEPLQQIDVELHLFNTTTNKTKWRKLQRNNLDPYVWNEVRFSIAQSEKRTGLTVVVKPQESCWLDVNWTSDTDILMRVEFDQKVLWSSCAEPLLNETLQLYLRTINATATEGHSETTNNPIYEIWWIWCLGGVIFLEFLIICILITLVTHRRKGKNAIVPPGQHHGFPQHSNQNTRPQGVMAVVGPGPAQPGNTLPGVISRGVLNTMRTIGQGNKPRLNQIIPLTPPPVPANNLPPLQQYSSSSVPQLNRLSDHVYEELDLQLMNKSNTQQPLSNTQREGKTWHESENSIYEHSGRD